MESVHDAHPPIAVYPGSFDPIHLGHVAIVERATRIFPRVIVAVLENTTKGVLFSPGERLEMMGELWSDDPAVEVMSFRGLLVNFLREVGSSIVIRGIRAVSDFEYEFMMAQMNRRLHPDAETVFLHGDELSVVYGPIGREWDHNRWCRLQHVPNDRCRRLHL